jgi:hypothetical protein
MVGRHGEASICERRPPAPPDRRGIATTACAEPRRARTEQDGHAARGGQDRKGNDMAGTPAAGGPIEHPGGRRAPALGDRLTPGALTGVGSLPHRSAQEAARFALRHYDLAAVPSLPRRSPAEGMIAQAVVGMPGVTLGQYGSVAVDSRALDPEAPVATDLTNDAFTGFRTFLARAAGRGLTEPVKWQFVGPITLGSALNRAGVDAELAFRVATSAVRAHLVALAEAVASALPSSPQVAVLDEPWLGELMQPAFPLSPDEAVDLLSTAMAAIEPYATVGVHCCGSADLASLLAAGPRLLSIPVTAQLSNVAGYLSRYVAEGGLVAWGVIRTDGPAPESPERAWRDLSDLWCELVRRGCDPIELRRLSLVTPRCGLGLHDPATAERVCSLTREIGRRIHDQAVATRFALGA